MRSVTEGGGESWGEFLHKHRVDMEKVIEEAVAKEAKRKRKVISKLDRMEATAEKVLATRMLSGRRKMVSGVPRVSSLPRR